MKFSRLNILSRAFAGVLVMAAGILFMTGSVSAQIGRTPEANPSASLEQCRNGGTAPGVPCAGAAWVTGNAGASNSHWKETDFMPYRMLFDNLTTGLDANPGTHVYTVVIGYDVKHSGAHAIDYLGTYNSTDAGTNPCTDVTGCSGWAQSTVAITADTVAVTGQTNPNTMSPVVQILGQNFTMWGGTLRSFAYTAIDGPMTNAQVERQVTLTFTAQVANPVLAWSGHIGWAGDWGPGQSAGGISGSPYHMRLISLDGSGGNQDRSLSADAVAPTGAVIIRKQVETVDNGDTSFISFPFTATANFGPTAFSLVDDNAGPGVDNQASQAITSFGSGNTITVTEGSAMSFTLSDVNCVESGIQNSTKSPFIGPATIIVEPFEVVTCTFINSQLVPTAAPATLSGRVTSSNGIGLRGVSMVLTNASTGDVYRGITNAFGYYIFTDLPTEDFYVISVSSKRYSFAVDTRSFTLLEDLADIDFVASP